MSKKKESIVMWLLSILGLVVISMCVVSGSSYDFEHLSGATDYTGLGSSPVVALFHSKGCPHCTNLMPTWEKFKTQHTNSNFKVLDFEKGEHSDLMSKHNIKGFPTIKLFKNGLDGDSSEYTGDRSLESLNEFASTHENFDSQGEDVKGVDEEDTDEVVEDTEGRENFVSGYSDTEYFNIEQLEESISGVVDVEDNDSGEVEEDPLNTGDQ